MTMNPMMPKDALGELLAFIAEHEQLQSIESQLAGSMSVAEVRAALQALGLSLKREAANEPINPSDLICEKTISKKTKEVLSCLSNYEEKKLLTAFGITED